MKNDRTFSLKGERTYLHSTSLFDDLLIVRGQRASQIDFRFAHKTSKQVSYIDKKPSPDDVLVAEWSDSNGQLYVVERDESILTSAPYDEAMLVSMLHIDGRTVTVPEDLEDFSRIDGLVAAFKHVLQRAAPTAQLKYAFVRSRLSHVPTGATEITYSRDLGAFFQGDICEHGEPVGQIFFGVWK